MFYHGGCPSLWASWSSVFALMLHSLVKKRFAVEKLLSVCGGWIRLLHYCVKGSHWCCCRFVFQSSHAKFSYCCVFSLIRLHPHAQQGDFFFPFSFCPPTVTERANHARDHLITEAQLDIHDGWVPELFCCHFQAYFLCQLLPRTFIIHEPKHLI